MEVLETLVWGLVLSAVALAGRRFMSQGLLRWMNIGSGLVLGGFGIATLVSLLAMLR